VHRFDQVDVFTGELTFGNPVAVVSDADDLSQDQMAAFARWTNLSETTFLLGPSDPSADYRLRIFTPVRELPFAGHPTLGSARAWLEAGGQPRNRTTLVQECAAGLVRVRRAAAGDRLAFAAPPLIRSGPVDEADLARFCRALRVDPSEVEDAQWVDNGPGWAALLLGSAEAVLRIEPDRAAMDGVHVAAVGRHFASFEADVEVRAFTAHLPALEDPVTGSVNAGIAQWLIGTGRVPERYVAAQGTRLGRRGRIHLEQTDGEIWVGGDTVLAISGSVAL
jgi:PhzF family phenazine biosynthesis protein